MRCATGCLVMLAIGCGSRAEPGTFPEPEELGARHYARTAPASGPSAPEISDSAKVRFHMQRHFDDLRAIERLLIAGRLGEARSRAFLLSRPAQDPGLEAWTPDAARVADAALALSRAASLDEACRLEPRVAAACAGCHGRAGVLPAFQRAQPPPPDEPLLRARMARHQWAADRLWEGLVGASDAAWRAGLEVLAAAPLPSTPEESGRRLQRLAQAALGAAPRDTIDDRASVYGELLSSCVACHDRTGARGRIVGRLP